MPKGYMYILQCANGSYYTGSTTNLELRLQQHQNGEGANHTRKYGPVKLVYSEEFDRIDKAFYREKQIQGWSRAKKEALIQGKFEDLHKEAECRNESHYSNAPVGSAPLTHRGSLRSLSEAEGSEAEGKEESEAEGGNWPPSTPLRSLSEAEGNEGNKGNGIKEEKNEVSMRKIGNSDFSTKTTNLH